MKNHPSMIAAAFVVGACLLPITAVAQAGKRSEPLQLAVLTPEQREQMRQQMREHWRQLPPEQRQEQRREWRERRQQISPEERQQVREVRQQQREQFGNGQGGGHPRRGW